MDYISHVKWSKFSLKRPSRMSKEISVVFRVRLRDASQTARSQVRFKLLKEIPKATSFRKTPLSPTLDVTGGAHAPVRTPPGLPAVNTGDPHHKFVTKSVARLCYRPLDRTDDHRSASLTAYHCLTPVDAPRKVQHLVRTLNG